MAAAQVPVQAIRSQLPHKYTNRQPGERALLAAAQRGDQDAFTALYRQNLPYVRRVGYKILRTNDLDDLCQDTFLLAFTRIRGFDGNSTFRTWITRIAMNQCLMQLRRRKQLTNGDGQLLALDHEDAAELFGRYLLSTEDRNLRATAARVDMERLLGGLTPKQRATLEAHYLRGATHQAIAAEESISIPASKSRVHLALVAARETLRQQQHQKC